VDERRAPPAVRDPLFGAKRFTDPRVGLPGVSPNLLSRRPRERHPCAR
jgi:hypothetical protein